MDQQELWQRLHENPELSGQEKKTLRILEAYLREETDLELHPENGWLYGIHREPGSREAIALRADIDAIPDKDGRAYHGCGHDGHAAMLAGAAALIRGRELGRNAIFLFQPAEETGKGAALCAKLFQREPAAAVFGLHNIPGYPLGTVLLRSGTFACASKGMIIRLAGRQSHAAQPRQGINPAFAAARLIGKLPGLTGAAYREPVLATVISVRVGERNFGISPGDGEVCLTIRARNDDDLRLLEERIAREAEKAAAPDRVRIAISSRDEFPATVNDPVLSGCLENCFGDGGFKVVRLAEPMSWSEDFGTYLRQQPGVFFGLGSGSGQPGLHEPDYRFPAALLPIGARAWATVLAGCKIPCPGIAEHR